jgi:uncharacterized protein (TIGR03437 family)
MRLLPTLVKEEAMFPRKLISTLLIALASCASTPGHIFPASTVRIRECKSCIAGGAPRVARQDTALLPNSPDALFSLIKKLAPSDPGAEFGWSSAISGDTAVVGAYNSAAPGSGLGAAYVLERNQGGVDNWGAVKKLTAPEGAQFGVSVGISGDTVVVGSWLNESRKGAAYVFERNKGGADVWGPVAKLSASDGGAGDNFGVSVGISDETIVIAAHRDESGRGSAYVYERNKGGNDLWGEVRKLTASDGSTNDQFGRWVAIDIDTIVVGANADDGARGSAYVFERNKGGIDNWGEVRRLTASDGAASDQFGRSVAISSDVLVVGAPSRNAGQGGAYVYGRNKGGSDNWGELKKLSASDGAASDLFGFSVNIDGEMLVVGALGDDGVKGSAYVYRRNQGGADNWGELKKLTAPDGIAEDRFGFSVAIHRDTLIVGAEGGDSFNGLGYVFASQCDQWIEQRKVIASDGVANDNFGQSVAMSGDTFVVGAPRDDSFKGSAYIYKRNKNGLDLWGEVKKLTAPDGVANDRFGSSVSVSVDEIVVGAFGNESARGAAYVFERNRGGLDNWGLAKKVTASDGGASDFFGNAVGISGDTIAVGAHRDNSGRGSVYVFERNKGGADFWGEVRKITASDGASADNLGISIAISADTIVAGASGDDMSRGAAYIFERNKNGADFWGEVRKLTASDGLADDFFGYSVTISGGTAVVGAIDDDSSKGAGYVFERNKGGSDVWGQVKKLTASDGISGDAFFFVSLDDDTLIVGASGNASSKGAAYVFSRNTDGADNWGEVKKLSASDGVSLDSFGLAVAISGDVIVIGAPLNDSKKGASYVFDLSCLTYPEATSVSAASFQKTALTQEMIVAAFGANLAIGTESGATIPLPSSLLGTTVGVRDVLGTERLAQLFFVSPGQVNYVIPRESATGPAIVKITSGSGQISVGTVEITAVSPGIFTANTSGSGTAAAYALRVRGLQQTYEAISTYDPGTSSFVPIPVDLGPPGDQIIMVMFGTGFRFRSGEAGVNVKVGGRTLPSLYSGIAPGYVGLDQLNISALPRDLVGAGVINIEITIDGKTANTTTVTIK